MIDVVLVEDEMLVLLGTKMCIQESRQDLNVAAAFASAEQALEYFATNRADVLITDIRLPGMSGLELVEKLKTSYPDMVYIILSCYAEFSYAREAFELGVDKYLLKHEIDEEGLGDLVAELWQQRAIPKPEKDNAYIQVENGYNEEKVRKDCDYVVGYLSLVGVEPLSDEEADIDYNMAAALIQEIMYRNYMGECFLRHNSELFCVFSFDRGLSKEKIGERLNHFFDAYSKNMRHYFNRRGYLIVSDVFCDLRDVRAHYDETRDYADYIFYYEHPSIIRVSDHQNQLETCPLLHWQRGDVFSERWLDAQRENIKSFFTQQKSQIAIPNLVRERVVRYVSELAAQLDYNYEMDLSEICSLNIRPDYNKISRFVHAVDLEKWLIQLLEDITSYIRQSGESDRPINRIIEYIDKNYDQAVNLNDLALQFHLNPVYLCQLFKQKTGVNFIQYINSLRIAKARQLLKTTDLSVEQISEQVGINSANYFVRLFKKMTGQTITQYRKKAAKK
jgi:YesN/AraC family two-component response regulator